MKKIWLAAAAMVGLGIFLVSRVPAVRSAAGSWDATLEAYALRLYQQGAPNWLVMADSASSNAPVGPKGLRFENLMGTPNAGRDVYISSESALGISTFTATAFNAIAPSQVGELIYSASTGGGLCVSTGTNTGAWVQVASSSTACK